MYLIDTNLLVRSIEIDCPDREVALEALDSLFIQGERLFIVPQIIAEFWNVCTRPEERNGLGLSSQQTADEVRRIEAFFPVLRDIPEVYDAWRVLVIRYAVQGKQVHDARLVASMLTYNLRSILTFNIQHFARYQEIAAVHPRFVIG